MIDGSTKQQNTTNLSEETACNHSQRARIGKKGKRKKHTPQFAQFNVKQTIEKIDEDIHQKSGELRQIIRGKKYDNTQPSQIADRGVQTIGLADFEYSFEGRLINKSLRVKITCTSVNNTLKEGDKTTHDYLTKANKSIEHAVCSLNESQTKTAKKGNTKSGVASKPSTPNSWTDSQKYWETIANIYHHNWLFYSPILPAVTNWAKSLTSDLTSSQPGFFVYSLGIRIKEAMDFITAKETTLIGLEFQKNRSATSSQNNIHFDNVIRQSIEKSDESIIKNLITLSKQQSWLHFSFLANSSNISTLGSVKQQKSDKNLQLKCKEAGNIVKHISNTETRFALQRCLFRLCKKQLTIFERSKIETQNEKNLYSLRFYLITSLGITLQSKRLLDLCKPILTEMLRKDSIDFEPLRCMEQTWRYIYYAFEHAKSQGGIEDSDWNLPINIIKYINTLTSSVIDIIEQHSNKNEDSPWNAITTDIKSLNELMGGHIKKHEERGLQQQKEQEETYNSFSIETKTTEKTEPQHREESAQVEELEQIQF